MSDLKTKGRRISALELEVLGEITADDLLARESAQGQLTTSQAPTLARLRGIHHDIARQLASGMTPAEVSAVTGYSLSRISTLQADPSFKELLSFYSVKKEEAFVDVQKRMAILGLDAASELADRLETKPESLSNSQLIEITKVSLDRAGYAPVQKNVSVGVQMTSDEIESLRKSTSVGEAHVKVIDVMPEK